MQSNTGAGSGMDDQGWVEALGAAEALYRLAEKIAAAGGRRLAEQLTESAAELPGLAATRDPDLARHRLRAEALLELAVRLGYVNGEKAGTAGAALGKLVQPAPAPVQATAAPPAAPAPALSAAPAAASGAPPPQTPHRRLPSEASPIEPPAATRKERAGDARPGHGQDRIVIDGSNFLGRASGYGLGDERSQERFLFRLQEYAHQHPAHRVTVFFDGRQVVRQLTAGVEIQVTSGSRPADDVIVDLLRSMSAPDRRRCILVTDDRELGSRANQEGIRVESVAWLASRLSRKEPSPGGLRQAGLNRGELSEWEQFFDAPPKRPGKS